MQEPTVLIPYSLSSPGLGSSLSGNIKNMEAMLMSAQQQQLRQLRRLQQMKRQAELSAAMQAAWEEKQARDAERLQSRESEHQQTLAEKAKHAADVELRRKAAQDAALEQQALIREAFRLKIEEAEQRADAAARQRELAAQYHRINSAKVQLRRQRIGSKKEKAEEQRRLELLKKEAVAERNLRRRQELHLLQEEIKREEESAKREVRAQARARAEQEMAAKMAYYSMRQAERERLLEERQRVIETELGAKSQTAKERFSITAQRSADVSKQEEAQREQLREKVEEKMKRADAIAEQRANLASEMQKIKKQMAEQEALMKQALDRMQRTGKWEFPQELLQALNTLESTISSPYNSPRSQANYTLSSASGIYGSRTFSRPVSTEPSMAATAKAALRSTGRPGSPRAASPGLATARHEAELQRVLEEEILREMQRENMLSQVTDNDERKRLIKIFAVEREQAKARILAVGSNLGGTGVLTNNIQDDASP